MEVCWDENKNRVNQQKHGVSFERAGALFTSRGDYLEVFDEANSMEEDRFIAIGPIKGGVVLVVVTEQDESTIRIISARWATRRERELFYRYMDGDR